MRTRVLAGRPAVCVPARTRTVASAVYGEDVPPALGVGERRREQGFIARLMKYSHVPILSRAAHGQCVALFLCVNEPLCALVERSLAYEALDLARGETPPARADGNFAQ